MIPATRYGRPYSRPDGSAFATGRDWRPLKLVLDGGGLAPDDVALLSSFAEQPELDLWRTAADAYPRLEIGEPFDPGFRVGGALSIRTATASGGSGFFGVYGVESLQRKAEEVASASDVLLEDAFNAVVFAAASDEDDADAFVTRRPFLLEADGARAPVAVTPAEALALLGLALRLHGNASIGGDMRNLRLEGQTFHFILARDLLRSGWRWFSGCVASSDATKDDSITYLGQTAHERFMRVLQIRDRLHGLAKQEPTRARGDEVVFQFETLLLFLSAAFDTTARVAHVVYLGGDYEDAGWRRPAWRRKLERKAPRLASITADGSAGAALLQVIAALRNTIHGEALRPTETRQPDGLTAQLVRVSGREMATLRSRIAFLGGAADAWGLREVHGKGALAADRFVEALLPHAVRLLNSVMRATETELLPGAQASQLRGPPPDVPSPNWWDDMFSWEIRQRVRLLGGL